MRCGNLRRVAQSREPFPGRVYLGRRSACAEIYSPNRGKLSPQPWVRRTMAFVRSIGRWTMTALVINCIIGSGIFGLPGELNRLLGRASPLAMIFAAIAMATIMASIAEVASQFSEAGGAYLYTRTAFGRFVGMQIGWFFLLAVVAAVAVCASLFVNYLATFLPWTPNTWERSLVMAFLIAIPTAANYCGVRNGANLSSVMTVAKLLPLAVLILFGVGQFA